MPPEHTPQKLSLKKHEKLDILWKDGTSNTYSLGYLRKKCPCALCKDLQEKELTKPKTRLTILQGNFDSPLSVVKAEMVGNYAVRIEWSDQHGSGIYSFKYLREIAQSNT